jgi:hypothetical protein
MSWARTTVARISHRRWLGVALARAAGRLGVGPEFMASSMDVVPRLRGTGGGGDAAAGGVGVRVAGHVACPFAGVDGQDEPGAGAHIPPGHPGPVSAGDHHILTWLPTLARLSSSRGTQEKLSLIARRRTSSRPGDSPGYSCPSRRVRNRRSVVEVARRPAVRRPGLVARPRRRTSVSGRLVGANEHAPTRA